MATLAHGQKSEPQMIKGYDHNGKLHSKKGELPKMRCMKGFIYEIKVEKWIKKCTEKGGKIIYPDTCTPRVWCSINVVE